MQDIKLVKTTGCDRIRKISHETSKDLASHFKRLITIAMNEGRKEYISN